MSRNAGSTKWRLRWGSFRGSRLNLKWSKRGVWWVDQWVLITWLHIESSRAFTWDIDMLIMLADYFDRGFWDSYFLCASLIYSFEILTCWLYWLIISCCLAHWSWFCHDYSDHFTCIHSPLYITQFDMLILWLVYYFGHLWACCLCISIHLIVVFSFILCVYIDDISEICLIECCMTTLLCVIACRLSVWVAHLSPYLPLSSLGHFLHSGSRFCKCEALCVCLYSDWDRG